MSEDAGDKPKILVIKKVKKYKKGGHHGGSWKIAYADFVTAMMTFFLLMWLLSLLNKYQLAGVSEYFQKPLKEAFTQSSNKTGTMNKEKEKQKEKEKEKPQQPQTKDNQLPLSKGQQAQQAQIATINKELDKLKQQKNEIQEYIKKQEAQLQTAIKKSMSPQSYDELEAIKEKLDKQMQADPMMRQFKNQLNFTITAEGLKVELRDLENKPMFSTGKTDFEKYAKAIMSWLSHQLNTYPNQLMIIGHTDGAKYQGQKYTNWELSVDRANATRRALIGSGMSAEKILKVEGEGDREMLNKANPLDPANRRIEIIVLSDDALKASHPIAPPAGAKGAGVAPPELLKALQAAPVKGSVVPAAAVKAAPASATVPASAATKAAPVNNAAVPASAATKAAPVNNAAAPATTTPTDAPTHSAAPANAAAPAPVAPTAAPTAAPTNAAAPTAASASATSTSPASPGFISPVILKPKSAN